MWFLRHTARRRAALLALPDLGGEETNQKGSDVPLTRRRGWGRMDRLRRLLAGVVSDAVGEGTENTVDKCCSSQAWKREPHWAK